MLNVRKRKQTVKLRTLIVDDEPLARERIKRFLRDEPEIEIIGECGNGADAIVAIKNDKPDLVFLDIQMPEKTGFDVIKTLGTAHMPAIVFVTAYDQHALKAFQVRALDYLLKPFDRERFKDALSRARKQLERDENGSGK